MRQSGTGAQANPYQSHMGGRVSGGYMSVGMAGYDGGQSIEGGRTPQYMYLSLIHI